QSSYMLLAEDAVRRGQDLVPEGPHRAGIEVTAGLLALTREDQTAALEAFMAAIRMAPQHPEAHLHVGHLALGHRDFARAQRHLLVALDEPRVARKPDPWLTLGVVRRHLQDYAGAEEAYRQARKVARTDPRPHFNLGLLFILQAHGDYDTVEHFYALADKQLRQFVKLARDLPELSPARAVARDYLDTIASVQVECCWIPFRGPSEADRREQIRKSERERLLELERSAAAHTLDVKIQLTVPPTESGITK
ncbi:MAG: hypothetical protein ACPG77_19295, partial [Nannocystaceae bacterium]